MAKLGIKVVVDETFTPPLSDATPLIQKVRSTRPDFLLLHHAPPSRTSSSGWRR